MGSSTPTNYSNISSISSTRNVIRLPLTFLYTLHSSSLWVKNKLFDRFIKMCNPPIQDLLQPINGSTQLRHYSKILWINKTLWLCHVNIHFKALIKESGPDNHLLDLVVQVSGSYPKILDRFNHSDWWGGFIIVNIMNFSETISH